MSWEPLLLNCQKYLVLPGISLFLQQQVPQRCIQWEGSPMPLLVSVFAFAFPVQITLTVKHTKHGIRTPESCSVSWLGDSPEWLRMTPTCPSCWGRSQVNSMSHMNFSDLNRLAFKTHPELVTCEASLVATLNRRLDLGLIDDGTPWPCIGLGGKGRCETGVT